eukprot:CAMPEP_0201621724 /NCGR_PEP_ID=MMETSP0492-20130828/47029_1 /ASSEMBLY_ACC=CAM_ASM_000837 /TAXON_ID=420259 /ORGANISM="Thalassiosira gravida, Strain GMp14c1" /LENGTH=53 /DNA_ID=CAMNT_0048091283 /DNA_START=2904 /DNA_END=3062 /DNA_ORIENTATION=+
MVVSVRCGALAGTYRLDGGGGGPPVYSDNKQVDMPGVVGRHGIGVIGSISGTF